MHVRFKAVESDLTHGRVQHGTRFFRQHRKTLLGVFFMLQHIFERHHFAENGRRFSQRNRRFGFQKPLFARQILVDAMPQFVRQSHHVVRTAHKVQHQIRMRGRHGGMSVRAALFAFLGRNVNPVVVKKLFADSRHFGRKFIVRRQNGGFGFVPSVLAPLDARNRRVSVPVFQLVHAQPVGFHFIVAMRNVLVAVHDGIDQSVNHFVFDLIGDVAFGNRAFVAAPFILDLLVFRQSVGNQSEHGHILFHHAVDFRARFVAGFHIGRRHQSGRFGFGQLFAADGKAQSRHRFVIQAVPSGRAAHRFVQQHFFQVFGQLVFASRADVFQPRRIVLHRFVGQLVFQFRIAQLVDFQRVEQHFARNVVAFFLNVLIKARNRRIIHIRRMHQISERVQLLRRFVQLFVFDDGFAEFRGRQFAQSALVAGFKAGRPRAERRHVLFQFGRIHGFVQIAQVPLRHFFGHRKTPFLFKIFFIFVQSLQEVKPKAFD